jgi:short-subunit dehydrogenase
MAYELKHQRVLPTGASSDIGNELAKQLAHSGALLALTATACWTIWLRR